MKKLPYVIFVSLIVSLCFGCGKNDGYMNILNNSEEVSQHLDVWFKSSIISNADLAGSITYLPSGIPGDYVCHIPFDWNVLASSKDGEIRITGELENPSGMVLITNSDFAVVYLYKPENRADLGIWEINGSVRWIDSRFGIVRLERDD